MGASSAASSTTGTRGWKWPAAAFLCAAGFLLLPGPNGHAARTANLSLTVNFTAAGIVTVTLPDGTPVGSTSGAPTVIPAGFYSLNLSGPGECINLPLFK